MVSPSTEANRRALIAELARRRGYYPPRTPTPATNAPAVNEQEKKSGGFLNAVGNVLKPVFTGSGFLDAVLPGDPGSDIKRGIGKVPVVGKPLAEVVDTVASPFTLATLGAGSAAGAALRGAGGFGRFVAPLVEPVATGSIGKRLAAEVALNLGAQSGQTLAEKAGLPEPLQLAAGLAGGVVGARSVQNLADRAARTAGGLSADEVAEKLATGDSTDKLTALLSSATTNVEEQNVLRSKELGRRAGNIASKLSGVDDPTTRFATIRAGQKGDLPTVDFSLNQQLGPEDIKAVEERVSAHYAATGEVFKEANAHAGLLKVWSGQLPQKNEIKLLEEALGTDFGQVLNNLANPQKLASWQTALDVVGVPRAVMASFDLSMPLRQGALGFTRKSWLNSWKPMAQAFADPKYAEAAAEEIATSTHPAVRALRDQGVITGTPGTLQSLEEAFTSGLAEVIPGVRQSERAAVTFLNKMRADYAKNIYDKWVDAGAEVGTKELDDLVKWTGIVTGRGTLPVLDSSRNAVTLMNSLFFSPKFLASRLQALNPVMYAQMAPAVRKEAARDMASFFGLGIAGLGAMAVAGKSGVLPGVSVELDPRSSDFAKVRSGQTRIDPWAGFQPIARYMAQLISGESKNSSGDINDRARATTLMNFARGKTAPVPSFLVDALTGTSFTGQEVDVATGAGMDRAAAERLVPLFAQDLADAIAVDGWGGAAKTLPALFGVGSQTYNSAATIRQAGAEEMYDKPWSKLTGKEQAAVNQAYAEQLAQQSAPSAKSVSAYVDNTNLEIRAREQQLFNALGTQIGNREFTGLMNDLLAERNNKIKGVVEFSGINESKDPTLLDRYFGLREQATTNGVVDYEKLDQLQQNFINQLPTEDQRIITERTSFAHAPEVQWWVDAKKTINESEYYDVQSQAMQQLNGLIQRIAPGVTTYNELNAASLMARTPAESMLISNVVKRVDQVTRRLQQVYRLRNPEVDEALGLVYGSTPIRMQLAR